MGRYRRYGTLVRFGEFGVSWSRRDRVERRNEMDVASRTRTRAGHRARVQGMRGTFHTKLRELVRVSRSKGPDPGSSSARAHLEMSTRYGFRSRTSYHWDAGKKRYSPAAEEQTGASR